MAGDFYDDAAREALLNALKRALREVMKPDMSEEEIEEIHLDAVEWLASCLVLGSGASEMKIRRAVHRGVMSVAAIQNAGAAQ